MKNSNFYIDERIFREKYHRNMHRRFDGRKMAV